MVTTQPAQQTAPSPMLTPVKMMTLLPIHTLSPTMTGRVFSAVLEHLGNWFHSNEFKQQAYRKDALHKMDEYAKIGFYPEVNLLLTFGASDNVFDVQALHRKIAMFASPPPSEETMELLRRL